MSDPTTVTPQERDTASLRGDILALLDGKNGSVILNALAQVLATIANAHPDAYDLPGEVAIVARRYQEFVTIPALSVVRKQ